ncbi:WecB/TagA/CpsF family glycosyltransferase [Neobacillus sp. CF12]|uniref:WecB/TagA/CpsF family glycosyltransferase n=1 Tax=Neobacillus sp. CF12 TaxID=3055864 RepID=UPI0025A0F11B|nr:WecB/TagA/CpsF family glycosyltransferase [Neobacillus sp. CF12]MDM5329814.1 WecB/TagA/CpsF family glycosyltransferase [Neobacillus sp. CF12]
MLKFEEVLGYQFVNDDMGALVRDVDSRITRAQKTFIVTANPEIITYAHSHDFYDEVLRKSDYITPDGVGIIMASKMVGTPLKERLTGFDLMENLLQLSHQKKYSIYFLGTKPNVIDLTVANIKHKYPNIRIAGFHHGYFDEEDTSIIDEIKQTRPDIVLVGLGFPKQEKWIADHLPQFQKGIFIGVGGCFNIWAGIIKRAPKVWRDLNLEWFYRLITQPARSKRMIALPIFIKRVLRKEFK